MLVFHSLPESFCLLTCRPIWESCSCDTANSQIESYVHCASTEDVILQCMYHHRARSSFQLFHGCQGMFAVHRRIVGSVCKNVRNYTHDWVTVNERGFQAADTVVKQRVTCHFLYQLAKVHRFTSRCGCTSSEVMESMGHQYISLRISCMTLVVSTYWSCVSFLSNFQC